jgi:hypothetical protein
MKGWHFESWRHSLAAKGIRTNRSFAVRDLITAYKSGGKDVEARGRRLLAEAEKPVVIPSTRYAPLTEREGIELAKLKFEASLRPRERRQIDVLNYIKKYVGEKEEDESVDDYLTRIRDRVGMPIWTSWAKSEYEYVSVGDKVVPKEVPKTLGEYITETIYKLYPVEKTEFDEKIGPPPSIPGVKKLTRYYAREGKEFDVDNGDVVERSLSEGEE